jgi:ATP-dependent RNA helicase SUPV3L1/SUV3
MRRLRENTMLNTEIGKTGEVIVEGHVIGRLDGFTFAPDAAEAGSDAKALQATALKALAGEIDARAEKLSAAPDEQFVLTSDGTIRWTGDAVAKLVAADDALHPRIRIISDERLSGAPREAVQTRLDLWLKTHIEKLLGPLFELNKAEDITGIARGIAFQLIEALGVLERSKISAEMKDLDQPSRASLRKYGVRFGAYHIYLPALLKPAARSLASLLWAEKQSNVDMSALSGAQHLASSGRTSFPIDKALPRDAYRVLGYRQCGERAVRVDILERLADLIRPALAWRETSPGTKPAGALDGRGFVITQAMTSLTGSAGEDFASILRALGYRMERRPPPPKPVVVEVPAAEAAPPEAVPEASAEANPEAAVEAAATKAVSAETPEVAESAAVHEVSESAPSATLLPDVAFSPAVTAEEVPAVEALPNQPAPIEEAVAVAEAPQEAAVEATSEAPAVSDAAPAETPTADALAAASPEAPAVPELIEVWRPGGRPEERRPRHDRARHRHHDRPQAGAVPAAAAAPGEPGEAPKHERHRRGRRDRNHEFRKLRPDAPVEGAPAAAVAEGAPASEPREDKGRPPRERFEGKGRDRDKDSEQGQGRDRDKGKFGSGRDKGSREHGGRDNGGRDKGGRDKGGRESGPSHRQYATSAAPRERDRPIDPNSPFAKLAALKEQLAANRKDR